ncbi:ABC transporter ATP-binding protein [Achromobacter aloeverae]
MAFILELLRGERRLLALASVLATGAALLELMPYWLIYRMARALLAPGGAENAAILHLALAMLAASILRLLVFGAANIASHRAAFRLQRNLRARLLRHLDSVPLHALQARTGALKKTLIDDVNGLEHAIGHTLPDIVAGLALPLIAAALLASVSVPMTLLSLALLPLAAWAHARSFRGLDQLLARWHAADTQANTALLEYMRGLPTLKAHGRIASTLHGLRDSVHALAALAESVTRRTALPYATFFVALSTNLLVVLPAGLAFHASGRLDLPTLLLFVSLGAGLTAPLLRVLSAFGALQRQLGGAARIADCLALPGMAPDGARAAASATAAAGMPVTTLAAAPDFDAAAALQPWRIEMRGVRVLAPPLADAAHGRTQGGALLDDVTLTFAAGETTAIVGPSGAGKSTLLGLLTGTHEAAAGTIHIGARDLRTIAPRERQAMVAAVFQDSVLMRGSLRENLLMARPGADTGQIARVLRAAGLDEVCARLPAGLDTLLSDHGASLSGGERQRVAIARALLKDAPILVLDEATAALDADSAHAVRQGLDQLARGRTVLMATHDLGQASRADRIVVLAQGRVAGAGKHADLLRTCPLYETLWTCHRNSTDWTLGGHGAARAAHGDPS